MSPPRLANNPGRWRRRVTSGVALVLLFTLLAYAGGLAAPPSWGDESRRIRPDAAWMAPAAQGVYGPAPVRLTPKDVLVVVASAVALTLVVLVWRSGTPEAPPPGRVTPPPWRSPRAIVSLACGHCACVIDLPRDRLRPHLFCPRCGRLMRDDA